MRGSVHGLAAVLLLFPTLGLTQPAIPTEKLGRANFPISCQPESQAPFNRAVAVLHSFWYKEAIRSFGEIAEKDPNCAMAHWGLAMSYWNQIWAPPRAEALANGLKAVRRAQELGAKTQREKDFIEAVATFYADHEKQPHRARATAYTKAMERIYAQYPNDPEAKVWYALALQASADPLDKTYANQRKSGDLALQVFKDFPDHPGAAHYCIHAYDYPALAKLGKGAADRYAKAAPSVPHALHMPSHIYVLVGDWEATIRANQNAQEAERDRGVPEDRLHALDYMVYAYLQRGQDVEAEVVAELGKAIEEGLIAKKYETPFRARPFHVAAMPARLALERRLWADAAELTPQTSFYPYADSVWHFARAIGHARSGAPEKAKADIDMLAQLAEKLVKANNPYWAIVVKVQHDVARGWTAFAEGRKADALALMQAAAKNEYSAQTHDTLNPGPIGMTAHEALGDVLLDAGRPAEALKAYEVSLEHAPNRYHALAGSARAAAQAGDRKKARDYYSRLVKLTAKASSERPEVTEAKKYLAKQ